MIRIVYLGRLAEIAGAAQSDLESSADLGWPDLLATLEDRVNPAISAAASDERTKVALNGTVLADKGDLIVRDGDEVALLPPVSGG